MHSFSHWFGGGRVDICCTYPTMYQSRHPTVQHFVTDICAYFRDKIVHCYYCLMHRWLCEVVFWDKLWNSNQTTNKYVRKFAFEMIFCSGFRMLRTRSDTRAYCIHNAPQSVMLMIRFNWTVCRDLYKQFYQADLAHYRLVNVCTICIWNDIINYIFAFDILGLLAKFLQYVRAWIRRSCCRTRAWCSQWLSFCREHRGGRNQHCLSEVLSVQSWWHPSPEPLLWSYSCWNHQQGWHDGRIYDAPGG